MAQANYAAACIQDQGMGPRFYFNTGGISSIAYSLRSRRGVATSHTPEADLKTCRVRVGHGLLLLLASRLTENSTPCSRPDCAAALPGRIGAKYCLRETC